MNRSWLVVIAIVAIGVAAEFVRARRYRRELDRLNSRPSMDDSSICSNLYPDLPKERVVEAWHLIGRYLRLPADKLRPSDRFGSDIGTSVIVSDRLDALAEETQRRMEERGRSVDLKSITSVDAFVREYAHWTD